jgi:hypothetical protein
MVKKFFVCLFCMLFVSANPCVQESRAAAEPHQTWATRLGGTSAGSGDDIELAGIATDSAGNVYVIGRTYSGNVQGGSNNASANNNHKGGFDAFVAKLTPDGALSWATYLGGSDNDYGAGIAVGSAGNIYVTGITSSTNFNGGSNNLGANNSHRGGGTDAFAARLTFDGALSWATYLGGTGPDDGYAIALDSSGNPYMTGATMSENFTGGSNNLGMNNARQGFDDAFVVKLTPDGAMSWGTHLGGDSYDFGNGIALDSSENIYVVGETWSDNFSASINSYRGGADAFVAQVSSAGVLVWSTYLGGMQDDWAAGIAFDVSDSMYLTGSTEGGFTGGSNNAGANNNLKGGSDAFAAKMTTTGALTWATYAGGLYADQGFGIAVDTGGNACITGTSSSNIFMGGSNNEKTSNNYKGINDAFAAKFTSAGAMSWAAYLGGEDVDRGLAVTVDANGNAYVAGDTASIVFQGGANNGSTNNSRKSSDDMFISKLGSGPAQPAAPVTVTLKGPGRLNVTFEANGIDLARLELVDTTEKSSLTIKSKLKKTPVYLDELDIAGPLKGLKAQGIFLTGALTATGGIGKISLTGTLPGSSIQASWISRLSVRGDFAGDMILSGAGAPPKGMTLAKASVKGGMFGSIWHISGNAGSVKVGTWGAGSILAVGADAGVDGRFFTGDDVSTGGSLSKVRFKYHATENSGDAFGIIADAFLKIKIPLPLTDGDFNIRQL